MEEKVGKVTIKVAAARRPAGGGAYSTPVAASGDRWAIAASRTVCGLQALPAEMVSAGSGRLCPSPMITQSRG